jgi:hypothetical protein
VRGVRAYNRVVGARPRRVPLVDAYGSSLSSSTRPPTIAAVVKLTVTARTDLVNRGSGTVPFRSS